MKNKYELKKYLSLSLILIIVLSVLFLVIQRQENQEYNSRVNYKVLSIIKEVKEKYPKVSDDDIMQIIASDEGANKEFLKKYSIDIDNDSLIKTNQKYFIINSLYLIISSILIILLFMKYNSKKDKSIESITKYIEEINNMNYKLDLDDMTEDELSILKNEIYKVTIMLKESAENSIKDKINLKDSLSDISHQLKTPLTSIMIMLDNIIDHPDMKEEVRNDFIKQIKIEISNINFLVQSILKLSKLDSNTVEYINKNIKLSELVNKSTKKLLPLCDLKDIKLNIKVIKDEIIKCDEMWQVEAISNILKNCIEHSNSNDVVYIECDSNNVYSTIKIKDNGKGISKKDLPHIFERFYKGENSDNNSIGIGLALSKTIINRNNGNISVDSIKGKGTCFTIKYFK